MLGVLPFWLVWLPWAAAVPRLPDAFSLWQWSSPVVEPDAAVIPPVHFANVWHYDGPHKRLLLRTGSPNGTTFVLHRGDVSPAQMYFYDTAHRSCGAIALPIGPPRPDWLENPNGTHVADVYIKTAAGEFARTALWCKADVPGWTPFCSYWAGDRLLRLTAPPGGPGVPANKLILNEYSNLDPGVQDPSLFEVPPFCKATDHQSHPMDWTALPFPYSHHLSPEVHRAIQPRPAAPFRGPTVQRVAEALNRHLAGRGVATAPCEAWALPALNAVARTLRGRVDETFNAVYNARRDRRALRTTSDSTAEEDAERALLEYHEATPDEHSTALLAGVRSGKCAEVVMWFAHHLSAAGQAAWKATLPQMPTAGLEEFPSVPNSHPLSAVAPALEARYGQQSVCLHCHFQPGPNGGASTAA